MLWFVFEFVFGNYFERLYFVVLGCLRRVKVFLKSFDL